LELQAFPSSLAVYFAHPMTPALVFTIIAIYFGSLISLRIIALEGDAIEIFFTNNPQSMGRPVALTMNRIIFNSVPANAAKKRTRYSLALPFPTPGSAYTLTLQLPAANGKSSALFQTVSMNFSVKYIV
jgi:hypothetical protein